MISMILEAIGIAFLMLAVADYGTIVVLRAIEHAKELQAAYKWRSDKEGRRNSK